MTLRHCNIHVYGTTKNKWNFKVVRASLNLSARVIKNPIYF